MNTVEEIFNTLSRQVILAENFRNEFDRFWKAEVGSRGKASATYLIRHTSLLSAFDNLLFLFCSREIWAYGGFGAKASEKGISGPVHILSHGDAIDKMIILCTQFDKQVKEILSALDLPAEASFLLNEIEYITKVNVLARENFSSAYPYFL